MMHVWKWSSSDKRLQKKKVLIVEDKIHRELSSHIHPITVRLAQLSYLSKLKEIIELVAKHISPNCEIYLSKFAHLFDTHLPASLHSNMRRFPSSSCRSCGFLTKEGATFSPVEPIPKALKGSKPGRSSPKQPEYICIQFHNIFAFISQIYFAKQIYLA